MKPDLFKNNRVKDTILDFLGNEYDLGDPDPDPEINDTNKMELLQMSYNNKFFVFQNRELDKMYVYELVERKPKQTNESFIKKLSSKQIKVIGEKRFQFVMRQQIQFENSEIFLHMI